MALVIYPSVRTEFTHTENFCYDVKKKGPRSEGSTYHSVGRLKQMKGMVKALLK